MTMRRDLAGLADTDHDVVVVGGGIYGACIAWDAALRGLRVALIERDDFGGATSANSLRIIHGGLRYLARGDLPRMRESIRERTAFLRIAPALVEPLPVVVPTTGRGTQSRFALGAAVGLNELASLDRNRGLEPARRLPPGRLLSLGECRERFASFPADGTSGGALWYDARMRHPERLTLAFVRAAAHHGASVANYCRMERVLSPGGRTLGVAVTDGLTGTTFEVRGRSVVVAAGPWTEVAAPGHPAGPHAFALNLVVGRPLARAAVGVRALTGPGDDPIIGGRRFLFLVPQPETTLIGTWYARVDRPTDALVRLGAAALLAEIRASCPSLELDATDVVQCQWGLLPLKAGFEAGRPDALADRPRLLDHGRIGGLRGMFSVEGVKYTTARQVAEELVDRLAARAGVTTDRCRTAEARIDQDEAPERSLEEQVRRAVSDEMAVRLSDVVFRRVWSGGPTEPRWERLVAAARVMGTAQGWSDAQRDAELEDVMRQIRTNDTRSESLA
jgi:glycerol-3-phosphate dehydrogenase